MRKHRIILLTALLVASGACSKAAREDAPTVSRTASTSLTRIDDANKVCMVNDQYMGKPQIPVDVNGKTYFGCCAMCKEKLETNAAARTGKDPVSGAPVDKASAVIARDATGKVFYFESEATLARYAP